MQYRRQIIWYYENGFSNQRRSLATHYEPLLWFSKSEDYYFEEIREPYKSQERLKSAITKNGKVWKPHPDGRRAGDVWNFPTLAGRRFREEKVDDRIVKHFSAPGSIVVVPFAGSGTECVSAARQGRRFWGSEIKLEYAELARSRLALEFGTQDSLC
jgi:DNA modification methylase